MASLDCEVCAGVCSKYRCVCGLRYCSLNCYRSHQEVNGGPCVKPPQSTEEEPSRKPPTSVPLRRDYPREDLVPPKLLDYLRGSRELRTVLQNPHLRELLQKLASQSDPAKMLDQLMQEKLFVEFADSCMDVIDPRDPFEASA